MDKKHPVGELDDEYLRAIFALALGYSCRTKGMIRLHSSLSVTEMAPLSEQSVLASDSQYRASYVDSQCRSARPTKSKMHKNNARVWNVFLLFFLIFPGSTSAYTTIRV